MKSVVLALFICNNLLIQYLFDYRFFTGENVWSAYVNITKCRIKSEAISPGQFGGGLRGRGSRGGQGQRDEIDACPLRISVAPRRPPNYIDPKTRYDLKSFMSNILYRDVQQFFY